MVKIFQRWVVTALFAGSSFYKAAYRPIQSGASITFCSSVVCPLHMSMRSDRFWTIFAVGGEPSWVSLILSDNHQTGFNLMLIFTYFIAAFLPIRHVFSVGANTRDKKETLFMMNEAETILKERSVLWWLRYGFHILTDSRSNTSNGSWDGPDSFIELQNVGRHAL